MNYRDADRGRLITLIGRMTDEVQPGARDIRAIIQRHPALAAYLPDLAADREALLKTGQIVEEEPPSDATVALRREADRRAAAGVKLMMLPLQLKLPFMAVLPSLSEKAV